VRSGWFLAQSFLDSNQNVFDAIIVMQEQKLNALRVLLWLMVLFGTQGCALLQDHSSAKSWSQISIEEDQEQRLSGFGWNDPP
jgi:hypothetical protein